MQESELLFPQKQENFERQIGAEKILQILRKTHSPQGNKVKISLIFAKNP